MPIRTHPGEILKEYALGLFAETYKLDIHQIIDLVDGTASVDPELAQKLSVIFGTSVQFWLNLQKNYDESVQDDGATSER